MPTQRFYNLPDEKKDRITAAAVDEFVANGIDAAEVAGVIRRAGIPRGSFYQYFADMDDLFGHVFSHLTAAKLAFMEDVFGCAGVVPFVDYVERTFRAGLHFAQTYPQGVAFARRVMSSTNPAIAARIQAAMRMGADHYRPLIDQDKAKGLIRESVDSEVLARLVMTVFVGGASAFLSSEADDGHDPWAMAGTLFDILRHGIQGKKGDG